MKKKIAGIILTSVLTFSAMAGVQASAEDRLWGNSMEADGSWNDFTIESYGYFAKPDRNERW